MERPRILFGKEGEKNYNDFQVWVSTWRDDGAFDKMQEEDQVKT